MYIALTILLIVISALAIRIKFRLLAYVNLLSPEAGYFSLRAAGFSVYSGILRIGEEGITITHKRGHTEALRLPKRFERKKSVAKRAFVRAGKNIFRGFLRVAYIKKAKLYLEVGNQDAYSAAVTAGVTKIALSAVKSVLMTKGAGEISYEINPRFDEDVFRVTCDGIIYLSLADIIYSVLYAIFILIKEKRL